MRVAIVGTALEGVDLSLQPLEVGGVTFHQLRTGGCLLFRHGRPHRYLPHQIDYRKQARALKKIGCEALLVTSSVGVIAKEVPLFEPLLLSDLIMLDNRLPDGSTCTLFETPSSEQGHLVLEEGLFSRTLSDRIEQLAKPIRPIARRTVFFYAGGPRTKTGAENRLLAALGCEVNSMTLAPEVVLAGELQIPCAGLVVGHKRSGSGAPSKEEIRSSLEQSRAAMLEIIQAFLRDAEPASTGNHLYRF